MRLHCTSESRVPIAIHDVIISLIFFCFFFFQAEDGIRDLIVTGVQTCALPISSNLASLGFLCFLIGRFTGSAILKKFTPYKVLGWYSAAAVALCLLIFAKFGWVSVACVFLTYFFMSIMFPTIFALGIFGLGQSAKKASSFIVMAIMGGAVLPKVMGAVADSYDLSRGFIVPTLCFAFVAFYGFTWPRLSKAEGAVTVSTSGGH